MKLKLLKISPSVKHKTRIFADFLFEESGIIVKGCRVNITERYGISISMPKLNIEKPKQSLYSPICFNTKELMDEFKKTAIDLILKATNIQVPKCTSSTTAQNKEEKSCKGNFAGSTTKCA